MKSKARPANKAEKARYVRLKDEIGCVCCLLAFNRQAKCEEIHHIVKGNKRMGHWYTLPLCRDHHQGRAVAGLWTSIAQGSKAFAAVHGTEIDLWFKVQHMLNLSDELPKSKIVPRRLLTEAEVSKGV
jgi:hypothetical protein